MYEGGSGGEAGEVRLKGKVTFLNIYRCVFTVSTYYTCGMRVPFDA